MRVHIIRDYAAILPIAVKRWSWGLLCQETSKISGLLAESAWRRQDSTTFAERSNFSLDYRHTAQSVANSFFYQHLSDAGQQSPVVMSNERGRSNIQILTAGKEKR